MEDVYGLQPTNDDYPDKALMAPENLMIAAKFKPCGYNYSFGEIFHRIPVFGPCSLVAPESTSGDLKIGKERDEDENASNVIKTEIVSHPSHPKLLDAYINCQKVGAPPEIACLLEEIWREKDLFKQDEAVSMSIRVDPELDEFMETYCNVFGEVQNGSVDVTR